uniref:Protein C19orf12 homolog n=1 Tax=Petromyzon marinus TaxID=7757 RepID=A0AAJ7SKK6_PETMA|nr:protein C19orf12 homolog [Petromyzon marinus]
MVLRVDEMMEVVSTLARQRGVQVALSQAGKGAIVTGGIALLGGLIAGPVGIAAGGALGGLVGMAVTRGTFRPLHEVLAELPEPERRRLAEAAAGAVGGLEWSDAAQLLALLAARAPPETLGPPCWAPCWSS